LRAVVFSDGKTIGDAQWVTELLRRRSIMIARLSEVLALLDRAAQQNLTKEQAITLVRQASEVRKRAAAASGESPHEQALEGLALYGVSTNLDPPLPPGQEPPEIQNRIKLISHAYRGWLEDLESAKPPAPPLTSSPEAVN
jgi:hypothetical protein